MANVLGVTFDDERDWIPNQYHRHLLVKNRVPKLRYLMTPLRRVCPDLDNLLIFLEINGYKRFSGYIQGRLLNGWAVRYMLLLENGAMFQHDHIYVFKATWYVLMDWLKRITKVCIKNYDYPSDKYYKYHIKKNQYDKTAELFWNGMYQTAQDMSAHHHDLLNGVKRINQYKKIQT